MQKIPFPIKIIALFSDLSGPFFIVEILSFSPEEKNRFTFLLPPYKQISEAFSEEQVASAVTYHYYKFIKEGRIIDTSENLSIFINKIMKLS